MVLVSSPGELPGLDLIFSNTPFLNSVIIVVADMKSNWTRRGAGEGFPESQFRHVVIIVLHNWYFDFPIPKTMQFNLCLHPNLPACLRLVGNRASVVSGGCCVWKYSRKRIPDSIDSWRPVRVNLQPLIRHDDDGNDSRVIQPAIPVRFTFNFQF